MGMGDGNSLRQRISDFDCDDIRSVSGIGLLMVLSVVYNSDYDDRAIRIYHLHAN